MRRLVTAKRTALGAGSCYTQEDDAGPPSAVFDCASRAKTQETLCSDKPSLAFAIYTDR